MSEKIKTKFDPKDKVVVGIDGKERLPKVALWAADVAQRKGTPLVVVASYAMPSNRESVVVTKPTQSQRDAADQHLANVAHGLAKDFPDLSIELVATEDDPSEALTAATHSAWMVAIGATTLTGLASAVLGKVSTQVVAQAHGPVAIIPDVEVKKDGPIVLALDLSHPVKEATEYAFEIGRFTGQPLKVVYAWEGQRVPAKTSAGVYDASMPHLATDMGQAVFMTAKKYPDVKVSYEAIPGDSVKVLREVSKEARAIIMGSRRMIAGLVGLVSGSTSRKLIDHTNCPLLIVPNVR